MSEKLLPIRDTGAKDTAQVVLDALPDQIYLKDVEGRFLLVNTATAMSLNTPPELVVGQTDFDFFPSTLAEQFSAEERDLVQAGQPVLNREVRLTDATGRPRWVSTTKVPLHDAAGNVTGIVGVNRDITTRKRLDEQVHLQLAALSAVTNGVCVTDVNGIILWVNPSFARLTGYGAEEVIGQNPRLLKSGEHDAAFYRKLWESIRSGEVWRGEIINRRKDGTLWLNDMTISPVRDLQGTIRNYVAIQQDITQDRQTAEELRQINEDLARSQRELLETYEHLKLAQRQLVQAEKLESVGRLAAGIAHEVKNPLGTLLMGIAFLEENAPRGDATFQSVLQDMREAVERADAIAREMLEYTSPRQLDRAPEDLNKIVERALRLVRHELKTHRVQVVRELAGQLPARRVDRIRVEQVFVNLFMNACHAMAEGGTLTVRTLPLDDKVVVEVLDTGHGIPTEALPKVFEPFFTTKPIGVGSGMGLAVAKQILTQHDATITIANRPTGGAVATVTFHNGKD